MKVQKPNAPFQIVAHRGLSQKYPENTLKGFKAALMQHADTLEIDVHFTKDKQLVVIYDDSIDRTSNQKGKVKDFTLEELKQFDFGIRHGGSLKNTCISTFSEVLSLLKKYSETLLIEIERLEQYPGIEKTLLEELDKFRIPSHRVVTQSSDVESVKKMSGYIKKYALGVLINKKQYWYKQPDYENIASFARFINPNYKLTNKESIKRAHEHHLKVILYTVNNVKDMKKSTHSGVDGIISDIPDDILKL